MQNIYKSLCSSISTTTKLVIKAKRRKMPTIGVAKYITSLFSISLIICE